MRNHICIICIYYSSCAACSTLTSYQLQTTVQCSFLSSAYFFSETDSCGASLEYLYSEFIAAFGSAYWPTYIVWVSPGSAFG